MPDYTYEKMKRVVYGDGLVFIPVCIKCGRFVKPDDTIAVNGEGGFPKEPEPDATCSKCGRTWMVFEGHF